MQRDMGLKQIAEKKEAKGEIEEDGFGKEE